MNPYRVLGVKPSDSIEHIKSQYKSLCKKYHPDAGGDALKFQEVKDAWNYLSKNHIPRNTHTRVWKHINIFNIKEVK